MKNRIFTISLIAIGLIVLSFGCIVNADDTGYISPENDGANYDEYQSPENAYTQSDTYARSGLADRYDEQDWHEFDFDLPTGCPVIDGILVEVDCYGAVSGINYDVKLTWDGTNYTTAKNTGNIPTSDTDTYIQLGGASDLWGHSWTYDELKSTIDGGYFSVLFHHLGSAGFGWIDHVRIKVFYTTSQPGMPSCYWNFQSSQCNKTRIHWSKGTGADYTLVKYKVDGYPTFETGTELYNGTGSYADFTYDTYNEDYYFVMWSWNTTYCRYSNDYDALYHSPCSPLIYQTNYNIVNTTGVFDTSYDKENGWTFWINYTSCINVIESLSNVTGNSEVKFNGTCNNVYNNYSTLIFLYENIIDATGTLEAIYKETTFGFYQVWANYTGTGGGSCTLKYLNYSDENITINITYWGCNNTNTTSGEVNEDNWLKIMGFSLESGELGIFFVLILFSLAFIIDKDEKKNIWKPILLWITTPIAIATGVTYLGFTQFSVEWWIGVIMFLFGILISFAGLYYALTFGRKNK